MQIYHHFFLQFVTTAHLLNKNRPSISTQPVAMTYLLVLFCFLFEELDFFGLNLAPG